MDFWGKKEKVGREETNGVRQEEGGRREEGGGSREKRGGMKEGKGNMGRTSPHSMPPPA